MFELISETTRKARKQYNCMAWDWLCNVIRDGILTEFELGRIAAHRAHGFKIDVNDEYYCATMKGDNGIYTFRAIPDLHKICIKHDLYIE